jgi:hypothetical protein
MRVFDSSVKHVRRAPRVVQPHKHIRANGTIEPQASEKTWRAELSAKPCATQQFCAGDWVEVRSKEEILRTLDKDARLEGLPFMPQLFQYCGQRFRVNKRAHKTCDTVSGAYVGRRLSRTVHLEHRCDGKSHGGCQAGCLIFWKEAWLKPVAGDASSRAPALASSQPNEITDGAGCTESDVWRATKDASSGSQPRYSCQATELLHFTQPLKWWDARQYVEAYRSGNASFRTIVSRAFYVLYCHMLAKQPVIGRPAIWLYDRIQALRGRIPFPGRMGGIPVGEPTPRNDLDLRPGDLVRVKPYAEILTSLDTAGFNRGLRFDPELVPYCDKLYRVKTRVEKFINEKTGKMQRLRTPAVILEGVYCTSRYSGQRILCPRSIYIWWREIWLERANDPAFDQLP